MEVKKIPGGQNVNEAVTKERLPAKLKKNWNQIIKEAVDLRKKAVTIE